MESNKVVGLLWAVQLLPLLMRMEHASGTHFQLVRNSTQVDLGHFDIFVAFPKIVKFDSKMVKMVKFRKSFPQDLLGVLYDKGFITMNF